MEPAIKLIGAALTPKGKYKIFLASDDEAKLPMGSREIDADVIRLLFPVPVSKIENAQELEARLHKGLTDGKHAQAVQVLHELITIDKVTKIKLGHIEHLKPAALKPAAARKKKPIKKQ